MTMKLYPESGLVEPQHGALVALVGDGTIPGRINATMAVLRELCAADIDPTSNTSLASRCASNTVYADNDEEGLYPIYQMSVNAFQSAENAVNEQMRVYVGLLLDREPNWPSLVSDEAKIDAILALMA